VLSSFLDAINIIYQRCDAPFEAWILVSKDIVVRVFVVGTSASSFPSIGVGILANIVSGQWFQSKDGRRSSSLLRGKGCMGQPKANPKYSEQPENRVPSSENRLCAMGYLSHLGILIRSRHHTNIAFVRTIYYFHMVIGVLENLGPRTTRTAPSFPSGQCTCKS